MALYIDNYTLLLILLGILVGLIITITILLRIQKKKQIQDTIPGVEEMAKTTFFWSDYHRGKIGNDE